MPDEPVIYYHPRCGSCRKALALLRSQGHEPRMRRYMDRDPLSGAQIEELARMAGIAPRDLLRTKDPAYLARGLGDLDLADAALCAAMAEVPALMQRPIVVAGDRAVVARPPERALSIL